MTKYRYKLAIILLLMPTAGFALETLSILVVGLMRDQAVVQINGRQHVLKTGQSSPEGVALVEANSEFAVLQFKGQALNYPLGSQFGGEMPAPTELPSVSIWPTNGMYLTNGSVNGYPVDFLVDTGASAIALNAATAQRLGLDFRRAPQVGVSTASGQEMAFDIMLEEVRLGAITLNNIRALVIDSTEPARALLGMSFLNQLDMQRRGDRLELIKKIH